MANIDPDVLGLTGDEATDNVVEATGLGLQVINGVPVITFTSEHRRTLWAFEFVYTHKNAPTMLDHFEWGAWLSAEEIEQLAPYNEDREIFVVIEQEEHAYLRGFTDPRGLVLSRFMRAKSPAALSDRELAPHMRMWAKEALPAAIKKVAEAKYTGNVLLPLFGQTYQMTGFDKSFVEINSSIKELNVRIGVRWDSEQERSGSMAGLRTRNTISESGVRKGMNTILGNTRSRA